MHGIEPRLVPVLTYLTDENMASCLKQVSNKHSKISSNIKACEIDSFNKIDNPITPRSELALWKLIMDIRTEESERFTINMTRNWKNAMELWVKKKYKKDASTVARHLLSWLHKMHGNKSADLVHRRRSERSFRN